LDPGALARNPSGKYVSLIRLPSSGEEWTETVDFKSNGILLLRSSADDRRIVLNKLQYDGKQLVDPETAGIRGPYIQQR
jgi:hypothetical protein